MFNWLDLHWVEIGLGASVVLLVLLFTTNLFRSNTDGSRWYDPAWLAWLAPAAYAWHQTEEYGRDALGRHFAFPDVLCASFRQPPYPVCSVPTATYFAINVPAIWGAGLICALLSRRHPLVGLGLYGVFITNATSHIGKFVVTGDYNPGVVTAFLIQLPLSLWVAYATFGRPGISKAGIASIMLGGAIFSAVLLGALHAFTGGLIPGWTEVAIQYVNPLWYIVLPWLAERHQGLATPAVARTSR